MEDNEKKSLLDSILELIDLFLRYVRQQIRLTVDQSVVGPIGKAGKRAGLFILAFTLFSIAAVFIAVFLFLLLATLVGYLLAVLIAGLVFVAGGGGALFAGRSEGEGPGVKQDRRDGE